MLTLLFSAVLVLFVIVLIYAYIKQHYSAFNDDPPGKKPQIFFGNLLNSGALTGRKAIHEIFFAYQRKYGDVFLFWLGPHRCPVFCLPEHAKEIFSDRHTFERSPLFIPNFDLLCPHSIINLTDAKWKRHARVMLPMFKRAKIMPYQETILHCVDRFIDTHLEDKHIYTDLVLRCQSLLLNIIALIAFDYDLDAAVDSPLRLAFEDFAYYTAQFSMALWLPRWLGKLYLRLNWKYQRAHRLLRKLAEQIVEQEQNKTNESENLRPKNLIASLVSSLNEQANDAQTSSGLTQAEMFDEVLTAIVAGSETTSTALSWFIFYMSKHPEIQQRIKQELEEHNLVMGDNAHSSSLTPETLDALVYCDCVAKEVFSCALSSIIVFNFCYRSFDWHLWLV
jgi:pentalenene oxygenase